MLPCRPLQPSCLRAKLLALTGSLHCSIVGTCRTTAELHHMLGKVVRADISHLNDHELHTQAVNLYGQHNASSKLLHKALHEKHLGVIKRLARVQGEAAVMQEWDAARREGDIPGTYWVLLTQSERGLRGAAVDVQRRAHAVPHHVDAANRADIRRLAALEAKNASLLAKVARQQIRLQEAVTSVTRRSAASAA